MLDLISKILSFSDAQKEAVGLKVPAINLVSTLYSAIVGTPQRQLDVEVCVCMCMSDYIFFHFPPAFSLSHFRYFIFCGNDMYDTGRQPRGAVGEFPSS